MKKKIIFAVSAMLLVFSLLLSAGAAELGDVDRDGKVRASDARKILRAAAKLIELDESEKVVADVDGDGYVRAGDARKALRRAADLIGFLGEAEESTAEAPTTPPTTQTPTTAKTPETTTKERETKTQTPPKADQTVLAAANAFFNGKFYLVATDDMLGSDLSMAVNGKNMEVAANGLEGMEELNFSVYIRGGKFYLKDWDDKKYYDFSGFADQLDINIGDLNTIDFNIFKGNVPEPELSYRDVDGVQCVQYLYARDDVNVSVAFVAEGKNIRLMEFIDADGATNVSLQVKTLTGEIPKDRLTTRGFTESNIMDLIKKMSPA